MSAPAVIRFRTFGALSLRGAYGRELRSILVGPKRLALLAYLAIATPRGFHRRDTLLALFWPEFDQTRARKGLRNALHILRRALGEDVVVGRGHEEIGLARDRLWCDAVAFEEVLDRGDIAGAMELYRGDLLEGFFVAETLEFERWIDRERRRLKERASRAAWALSKREETAGALQAARSWASRACELDSDDERALRRLMRLDDRLGDRAAALHAYREFALRVEEDYETEPAAETQALARALRARSTSGSTDMGLARAVRRRSGTHEPAGSGSEEPRAVMPLQGRESGMSAVSLRDQSPRTQSGMPAPLPEAGFEAAVAGSEAADRRSARHSRIPLAAYAGAAVVALIILFAVGAHVGRGGDARRVLAIGYVADYTDSLTGRSADAMTAMLSAGLSRIAGVETLGRGRLYELLGPDVGGSVGVGEIARASRRAGATDLVAGELHRSPDGELRLHVWREDLASGRIFASHAVSAGNRFSLVDRAVAEVAEGLGLRPPPRGLAAGNGRSVLAFRFYEEGLRAYYQGDDASARRLFEAALTEDPRFAMAAYHAWLSTRWLDLNAALLRLEEAVRLADGASDRERLLIRAAWADEMGEPDRLALAESLATRYPSEPDGYYFLGRALIWGNGRFLEAVPPLRRVIEMDSLALRGSSSRCRACDAYEELSFAYWLADSLEASQRAAREWIAVWPRSSDAWMMLIGRLEFHHEYARARAVADSAAPYVRDPYSLAMARADIAIRAGDFPEAEGILLWIASYGTPAARTRALWYHIIGLRAQGRLREGLQSARRFAAAADVPGSTWQPWEARVPEAQVLFEMGRFHEAAALFDSLARRDFEHASAAKKARNRAWLLTHAAAAHAAAGDTASVRAFEEEIRAWGSRSGYARDPRLHHHVRGLLLAAQGRNAEAVRAFRRAIFSPTGGYTRTNLQLAMVLLALDRADEAVAILQPALYGPLDASNYYVTTTEIHRLLAVAHRSAGAADSAAYHETRVAAAWRAADPGFPAPLSAPLIFREAGAARGS